MAEQICTIGKNMTVKGDVSGDDAMIIGEGANTMDIGRSVLPNFQARHRLRRNHWTSPSNYSPRLAILTRCGRSKCR